MSFGFRAFNDTGNLLVSDSTYNLIFTGKATYLSQAGIAKSNVNEQYYRTCIVVTYAANSQSAPVAFVHSPAGYYASIAGVYQAEDGSWRVDVHAYPDHIPEVYIFERLPVGWTSTGYGMRVYRSDGSIAFDSGFRNLQIRNLTNCPTPGCAKTQLPEPEVGSYCAGSSSTPLSTIPAKAAVAFATTGKSMVLSKLSNGVCYSANLFIPTGRINAGSFEIIWNRVADSCENNDLLNLDIRTLPVVFIDAAFYDTATSIPGGEGTPIPA